MSVCVCVHLRKFLHVYIYCICTHHLADTAFLSHFIYLLECIYILFNVICRLRSFSLCQKCTSSLVYVAVTQYDNYSH